MLRTPGCLNGVNHRDATAASVSFSTVSADIISRVAVVTGAARGIGAAIAARLCRDGCTVALLDVDAEGCRTTADTLNAEGGHALALETDVADARSVEHAVADVADRLGPPTILVSNAGFARDVALEQMSFDDWDAVHGVHLRGAFLMTRAILPLMRHQGWGRIVAISSISANGHAGRANYCAAKAGLEGFIRSLAVELGPLGITANAVSPGLIVTAMTKATADRRGLSLDEYVSRAAVEIPVRRTGTPGDIAHAVSFLVGEEAGFITGEVLRVSGGVLV